MNREQRRAFAHENGVPMPPAEEPAQPGLQLAPVPTTTTVGVAQGPTESLVVLQVQTPQGLNAFFLSAEHARTLAGQLSQSAAAASLGLTIVGEVAPNGNGAAS